MPATASGFTADAIIDLAAEWVRVIRTHPLTAGPAGHLPGRLLLRQATTVIRAACGEGGSVDTARAGYRLRDTMPGAYLLGLCVLNDRGVPLAVQDRFADITR